MSLLLLLLLGAVVTVPLGDRLGLPAPVLMTLIGIAMAFMPFVPNVDIPPEIILPALLPPLLYATVQRTSWRQFAANRRPIFLLAVALVFVTTAAVAAVANSIVPGLPIAAAVALGALVAPPDPVAATAVAGSVGLPRRLVSILEGEGLFNDVTAIVLYHVAIAAAVSGTFSLPEAFGLLALSAVVAVAVGLALGWLTIKLMNLLGDATLQVGLTLLVPFVAYVLAEELMGSGVLAVLTVALFLAEHTADADDVLGGSPDVLSGTSSTPWSPASPSDSSAWSCTACSVPPTGTPWRWSAGGSRSSRSLSAYGCCGCCPRPGWPSGSTPAATSARRSPPAGGRPS